MISNEADSKTYVMQTNHNHAQEFAKVAPELGSNTTERHDTATHYMQRTSGKQNQNTCRPVRHKCDAHNQPNMELQCNMINSNMIIDYVNVNDSLNEEENYESTQAIHGAKLSQPTKREK